MLGGVPRRKEDTWDKEHGSLAKQNERERGKYPDMFCVKRPFKRMREN